jgi:mannose-1-phosphate guanylyltransferase
MQAVILVGGKGTRLRPLTTEKPKPIVTFADRPFMVHMLQWLSSHGVDDIVLCCGFGPGQIQEELGDGSQFGVRLRYLHEPTPLDTGGALGFAADLLQEDFLMLNGDVLTDLDLSAQIAQHKQSGAIATLGLVGVEDPSAYGLVLQNEDRSVRGFLEKPEPQQLHGIDEFNISAGVYVLNRKVLDYIEPGRPVSIEREVWPALVGNGLHGYKAQGAYWMDIGTPERYIQGTADILSGAVHTETLKRLHEGRLLAGSVDETATITGQVLIEEGARILAHARIAGPVVIGKNVVIGEDCTIEKSVVLEGAVIGEGTAVLNSIICEQAQIGASCLICKETMVGAKSIIADNIILQEGRVAPNENYAAEPQHI